MQPFDVAAFGAHAGALVLEVDVLDVQRKDLLCAGGGLIQQSPQRFLAHRDVVSAPEPVELSVTGSPWSGRPALAGARARPRSARRSSRGADRSPRTTAASRRGGSTSPAPSGPMPPAAARSSSRAPSRSSWPLDAERLLQAAERLGVRAAGWSWRGRAGRGIRRSRRRAAESGHAPGAAAERAAAARSSQGMRRLVTPAVVRRAPTATGGLDWRCRGE